MTGHDGRRASRRRDRGARGGRPNPTGPAGDWRPAAEVEDIETLRVTAATRRGGLPFPPRGIALGVALVALLGIGFGALGGRETVDTGPRPGSPAAAVASAGATPAPPAPPPGPTPLVTPWTECTPLDGDVPRLFLEVDGRPTELATQVTWLKDRPDGSPPLGGRGQTMLAVPSDVHAELWIDGAACANAWTIGTQSRDLESVPNVELDPMFASQNRFELRLAPFAGQQVVLSARLVFPELILDVAQLILVEPYDYPIPRLSAGGTVQPIEGCDVVVTLGNGYETDQDCDDDLPFPPDDVLVVDAGARITFETPGWNLMAAVLTCGHLSGLAFVAEPEPGCFAELDVDPAADDAGFTADFEGSWTLAIGACALDAERNVNRVCGTWFADVRVEP